jgi:hypothetical protein
MEKKVIVNLTQHPATPEQIAQGVVDLDPEDRAECARLLTFDSLPTAEDLWIAADQLVELVKCSPVSEPGCRVMIADYVRRGLIEHDGYDSAIEVECEGGAPFFMEPLATLLRRGGYCPVFAFSRRESVEQVQADGSVRKVAVFRHMGFVVGIPPV